MKASKAKLRKVIDIQPYTFHILSIMDAVAEDFQDNMLYAWAVENDPEGSILASEEEKAEFEVWLGV